MRSRITPLNTTKAAAYNAATARASNLIGEQISEARRSRKLSAADLCKLLAEYGVEIAATGVCKWEGGRTIPNAYQLLAVAHALGLEDDLQYFVGGKRDLDERGQRKLAEYKADLIATGLYKPVEPRPKIQYVEPLVSELPISAGPGEFLDEGSFTRVRFPENAVPENTDFGVYVSGDSMEPVYHDRQIVWVQRCKDLRRGEVGVFIYNGCGYLKMFDEQEPNEERFEEYVDSYGVVRKQPVLVSYNEKYPPIVVSPDVRFQIIGRVLS